MKQVPEKETAPLEGGLSGVGNATVSKSTKNNVWLVIAALIVIFTVLVLIFK